MTKEQMLATYGNEMLEFIEYYKYTFIFEKILDDGTRIYIAIGGIADDIYRFEIKQQMKLSSLFTDCKYMTIRDETANMIFEHEEVL